MLSWELQMPGWRSTAGILLLAGMMACCQTPAIAWQNNANGVQIISDGDQAFLAGDAPEAIDGEPIPAEPDFDAPPAAYPLAGDIALSIGVPTLRPGFEFHGGLLYLQPSSDNLGWGIITVEKNYASPAPLATPYWQVQTLTPGYAPGVEVGGGYTFDGTGRDVQLDWQHLRTSTSDQQSTWDEGQWISPFSQTGPPTADSFIELPDLDGVNKLQTAKAQVKFAYDAVNLDFGQFIRIGSALDLRLFAGLSYARLQQQITSTFYGQPIPTEAPLPESASIILGLDNTSSFWGVGPQFGFDSIYTTRHGIRLTGGLAGAALIGQTQPAQYEFSGVTPALQALGIAVNREWVSSEAFTHVVWAMTAKLGLGYSRPLGRALFSVDTGYLAALYVDPFSGYETNENILALQIGSLSSGSIRHIPLGNFSLHGFYLNAGLSW